MSADLPADVRDRAAQAAKAAFHERLRVGNVSWHRIVDAVVSVVAEEIERPLQAELSDALRETSRLAFGLNEAQARIEGLEEKLERAERTMGGYAVIHVRAGSGESWPVVQRVSGGWQSGAHHYPDSAVLGVRGLTIESEARDG